MKCIICLIILLQNFSTSWNGARDVCSYWNRDMAILTDDEFNFLRTVVEMSASKIMPIWWNRIVISTTLITMQTALWLGASMRTDEINSWDFRPAFKNWDGSDFTTKNLVFRGEHMVCLYFAADDHVFSDFCNGQRGVLCQHWWTKNSHNFRCKTVNGWI